MADVAQLWTISALAVELEMERRTLGKILAGMEPVRVEMIVAATIFVSFVIRECNIKHLSHSEFALKEGVVSELVGL